jgi:Concanavalin A-like lectin/glucanases superfamily
MTDQQDKKSAKVNARRRRPARRLGLSPSSPSSRPSAATSVSRAALRLLAFPALLAPGAAPRSGAAVPAPVVWRLEGGGQVGGFAPLAWGSPQPVAGGGLRFDGRGDGLVVPADPLQGWPAFTVAVLFRPDAAGPAAQRFLHVEDARGERLTVELRLEKGGCWCLDTFLHSDLGHRTLRDPRLLHRAGRWAWAELTYDGRVMRSYVDGRPELSGAVPFPPMAAGRSAIGVRLNRVFWFRGEIRELRFYRRALPAAELPAAPELESRFHGPRERPGAGRGIPSGVPPRAFVLMF